MRPLILTLTLLFLLPATAAADIRGVELAGSLPEAKRAISINFIAYADGRDVMFVSTQEGLFSYDLTADPTRPRALDHLTKEELMLPGDQADPLGQGFWENEDMDVDPKRKLVLLSRDVLAFSTGVSGVHVVDAADPANLRLGAFVPLPHGHTTTCIDECRYLWTAGASARAEIYVTDLRDPALPVVSPIPIQTEDGTGSPSGIPTYSHDVQVDSTGIAWVSGESGVRGYRTSGDGSPTQPLLHGGGRVRDRPEDTTRGMHNSARPAGGDLIYVTHEAFGECEEAGRLVIASLKGKTAGSASDDLSIVGTWSPKDKEGAAPGVQCTAHYFALDGDLLVQSFYEQGTRFLDVSDPANPIQIAYFRPEDGRAWAPYLRHGLVYVADNHRGVDILRLTEPPAPSVGPGRPGEKPPQAAPGTAECTPAPTAVLARRGLRVGRRGVRLHGSAGDGCGGAARVEVAVAKVRAGRCRFLGRNGRLGRPRDCRSPVWQAARGGARWTFTRRGRLPRGSYAVTVRARGRDGRPGEPAGSKVSGTSSRPEVLAPPLQRSGGLRPSPTWGWLCPL
jgi:hypothetical protein